MGAFKPIELLKNSDQQREQWLEMRLDYINSTESSALFSLNKYQTFFELWHNKKMRFVDSFDNQRMKVGRFVEPAIAKLALDEMDARGTPFKSYMRHPDAQIASSFDWKITGGKHKKWLLEIKNVDKWIFKDYWVFDEPGQIDEAPHLIEIQLQHQLAVTGRPGVVLAALVGGNELKLIYRERNEEMIAMILNATGEFWRTQTENIEPAPNFEVDAGFVCKLFGNAGGEEFIATGNDPVAALIGEDDALKAANNKIVKRRKEIKAECFTLIGDADAIIIDGKKRRATTAVIGSPEKVITTEMVGEIKKGRAGFRNFR